MANVREQILRLYEDLRAGGSSPREAWRAVKEQFVREYAAGDAEQAWKNASGSALEDLVLREFDRQRVQLGLQDVLQVQHWKHIQHPLVKRILSESLWLRGELQEPYTAESQVDFVAMEMGEGKPVRVVATYSCKASLRERFQQDLYWAEKFRSRGIRLCFITLENDGVLHQAISSGELRSKQAKMAAALYDRIYLFTEEPIQHYLHVFRPIDQLGEDLLRWLQAG